MDRLALGRVEPFEELGRLGGEVALHLTQPRPPSSCQRHEDRAPIGRMGSAVDQPRVSQRRDKPRDGRRCYVKDVRELGLGR